jgi:acyl-CoA reductase-like NAD-dependent aldehyde dehydrogenase
MQVSSMEVNPTIKDASQNSTKSSGRTPDSEANEALRRAKDAHLTWASLSLKTRLGYLRRLEAALADEMDTYIRVLGEDCKKTPMDALMTDIFPTLEAIRYYRRHAKKMLADVPVRTPLYMWPAKSRIVRRPYGAVLVLAPWNFPVQLALVPSITALAAGNTVVLKPSEVLTGIPQLLTETIQRAGLPPYVLQIVEGDSDIGRALVNAGPDKIFFTGSVKVGKEIAQHAAQMLIPCDLELSGKDALLVLADANLERAARAAVWGGFLHSGQVCVSVERVYVDARVKDQFVRLVCQRTLELRQSTSQFADLGGMTTEAGLARMQALVDNAVARGAVVHCGGAVAAGTSRDCYLPTVLTNVTDQMDVMREEIFGPILPIISFTDESEAIRRVNASEFGLGASIFTSNQRHGMAVARQLNVGTCSVNGVILQLSNMNLPFGGVKASGYGRYHGAAGIQTFTYEQALMTESGRAAKSLTWFPYDERSYQFLRRWMHWRSRSKNKTTTEVDRP